MREPSLDPEPSASTNFATSALDVEKYVTESFPVKPARDRPESGF